MQSQAIEILVIGHAALDLIFRVPRMPAPGQKQPASEMLTAIGGPACNAAIAISRMGGRPVLLARIGTDAFGQMIEKELADFGIDRELLFRIPGAPSSVSSVYVDDLGERQVVNILPRELSPSLDLDHVLRAARSGRFPAALGDSRWPQASAQVFRCMPPSSIRLVDFERTSPELIEACINASHIFFSQDGLEALTGTRDAQAGLREAATRFVATVGVTAGAEGTYWLQDEHLLHEPALSVQVIETLAAGDVWHGAATLALAQGIPLRTAIRRANAVAALKCTRPGGSRGMPAAEEISSFLEQVNA